MRCRATTRLAFAAVAAGLLVGDVAQAPPTAEPADDGAWANPSGGPAGPVQGTPNALPLSRSVALLPRGVVPGGYPLVGTLSDKAGPAILTVVRDGVSAIDAHGRYLPHICDGESSHELGLLTDLGAGLAACVTAATEGSHSIVAPDGSLTGGHPLVIVDGQGGVLKSCDWVPLAGVPDGLRLADIRPMRAADLDRKGTPELIVWVLTFVPTEDPEHPTWVHRRFVAYDTSTWKDVWTYDNPGTPGTVICADLTRDPGMETVLGLYAVGNDVIIPGPNGQYRDDRHAYLAMLDAEGEELWCVAPADDIPGVGSDQYQYCCRPAAADLGLDGRLELVAVTTGRLDRKGGVKSRIALMNRKNGRVILKADLDGSFSEGYGIANVDDDPLPEVVVGASNGVMYAFDSKLRVKQKLQVGVGLPDLTALADLDGDGAWEALGVIGGRGFLADFQPEWVQWQPVEGAVRASIAADCDGDGCLEVLTDTESQVSHIMEAVPSSAPVAHPNGPVRVMDCPAERVLAWSATGEAVAWADNAGVHVSRLDELDDRLVLPGDATGVSAEWSKDGRRLLLVSPSDRGRGDAHRILRCVGPGFQPETVYEGSGIQGASLSPDGKLLALSLNGELRTVPVDRSEQPRVAADVEGVVRDPLWSPDGEFIAFLRGTPSGLPSEAATRWDLCVIDHHAGATEPAVLTEDDRLPMPWRDTGRSAWGPDGKLTGPRGVVVSDVVWSPDSMMLACSAIVCGRAAEELPTSASNELCAVHYSDPSDPVPAGSLCVGRSQVWVTGAGGGDLAEEGPRADERISPRWSPSGHWLAHLQVPVLDWRTPPFQGVVGHPRSDLVVGVPGGKSQTVIESDEVMAFAWCGAGEDEVVYLRDGAIWRQRLLAPPEPGLPTVSEHEKRMLVLRWAAAGALAMLGLVALRLDKRVPGFLRQLAVARVSSRLGFSPGLLEAVLRRLDVLQCTAHSLKGAVFLPRPPGERGPDVADLRNCLHPENLSVVRERAATMVQLADQLARDEALVRQSLLGLSNLGRSSADRALDAALSVRAPVKRLVGRILRHGAAVNWHEPSDGPRPDLAGTLAADLWELQRVLSAGGGLLGHLRDALAVFTVAHIVSEAATQVSARASQLRVSIEAPPSSDAMALLCADPEFLVNLVGDCLHNSLDAIADEAEHAGPPYAGRVRISAQRQDSLLSLTIEDNGCGIEAAVLGKLASGEPVSTKGTGRGSGLATARRVLALHPGGSLRVESAGPHRGATVTICVRCV